MRALTIARDFPYLAMLGMARGSDIASMSCRYLGAGEAVTGSSVVRRCGSNARAPRCCIAAFMVSRARHAVLVAVEGWYEFPEIGCHLGNVG